MDLAEHSATVLINHVQIIPTNWYYLWCAVRAACISRFISAFDIIWNCVNLPMAGRGPLDSIRKSFLFFLSI